jgi:hypothetical protein
MAVLLPESNKLYFLVWQSHVKNTIKVNTMETSPESVEQHELFVYKITQIVKGFFYATISSFTSHLKP